MENTPDSGTPSYRTRNLVLAVLAGLMIVAGVVRLLQTQSAAPPAAEAPAKIHAAPQTTPTGPASPPSALGGAIDVEVAYSGALESLPDTAKVYVFIRPVGERMPLAVQTYAPKDLPVNVEFSNPAGAAAGASVEAVARLSLTGTVTLQSGDSEVVSAAVRFGERPQRLSLLLGAAGPTLGGAAAATPAGLRIAVHLALGAGVDLPPTTTVFLVVREAGGSPMPLAVKRMTVADLPADVVLTDADAMMPGRSLSGTGSVELVARASRSGNVKPAPGDWEAHSGALPTTAMNAATTVQLVIADPL